MIIAPDVSYYQKKVDSSFNRQWLIFRCCDGNFSDPNASFNADWCRGAVAQGRLLGWTTYVVYRPGMNLQIMAHLNALGPLDWVMIDVEGWSGQIVGDHSADINALEALIAGVVGAGKVWGYGNQGDLASIWPHRNPGQLLIVAAYGPNKPNVPNMIGWQYTNGVTASGSRPLSSAPFGACDHNELYVDELSPSGGGTPIGGTVTDPNDPTFLSDAAAIVQNGAATNQNLTSILQAQGATNELLAKLVAALTPPVTSTIISAGPSSYTFTGTVTPEA